MPNPPVRTELVDSYPNPSVAVAKAGIGKMWDWLTGLHGTDGSRMQLPDGAVGTPVVTFASDTDSGLYKKSADVLGVSKGLDVGTNATVGGNLTVNNNTTFGDGPADSVTINAATVNVPNGVNIAAGNLGVGVAPYAWSSSYKSLDLNTVGAVSSTTTTFRLWGNAYASATGFIYKTSSAATRIDLGSGISFFVAPPGNAGDPASFTQVLTVDNGGLLFAPTWYSSTTASAANCFVSSAGQISRSTSLEETKNKVGELTVEEARAVVFGSPWFSYTSKLQNDDPARVYIGTGARAVFQLDRRFVHYDDDEPNGVQYERYVAPLSVIAADHESRIDALRQQVDELATALADAIDRLADMDGGA